jgi:sugar/nucleoside kinase (ribokinase family)
MLVSAPIDPIDYLVIGHLTCDITPQGCQLGGTAAYAALMAKSLGLRPGIVTSTGRDLPLEELEGIPIVNSIADYSTTFENIHTNGVRYQIIRGVANSLGYHHIPDTWRTTPIVHLAPVAQELETNIIRSLASPLIGLTPQGWLRSWDDGGRVIRSEWPEASFVFQHTGAVVISINDISHEHAILDEFITACPILVVTAGHEGADVYWNGDVRRFRPLPVDEVDTIGSGDVFAAAFFTRLYATRDPWEAGRFATLVASYSVTRKGMASIPTTDEISACLIEVI